MAVSGKKDSFETRGDGSGDTVPRSRVNLNRAIQPSISPVGKEVPIGRAHPSSRRILFVASRGSLGPCDAQPMHPLGVFARTRRMVHALHRTCGTGSAPEGG